MPPRQKTFELVPNAPPGLGNLPATGGPTIFSKPPMTTKQAKKLHKQVNKGPKLSKAEQRRIELMEQDRIRKEFEAVKKQDRARIQREKKRAKEDKEKEERRKKGLPMVDVHPSQDVISRFLFRAPSKSRTASDISCAGEDSDTAADTASDGVSGAEAGDDEQDEPTEIITDENELADKENQAPEFDCKTDTQLLDESEAEDLDFVNESRRKRPKFALNLQNQNIYHSRRASAVLPPTMTKRAQEIGTRPYSRASSVDTDDTQTEILVQKQLIADIELASSRSLAADQSPGVRRSIPALRPTRISQPGAPAPNRKRSSPPMFKPPAPPTSQNKSKIFPRYPSTPHQSRRPDHPSISTDFLPPSSTQLFLLDHVDDLFPTPSQEARELSETRLAAKPKPSSPCLPEPPAQPAPQPSPPKKRMFGSSGPGAEVLVAMERSYQQSLREQRTLAEEIRRVQRLRAARPDESTARDLDLLPDDLDLCDEVDDGQDIDHNEHDGVATGQQHAASGPHDEPTRLGTDTDDAGNRTETRPDPAGIAPPVASQDTDYGDFGADVSDSFLQLLDGGGGSPQPEEGLMEFTGSQVLQIIGDDTSWLDDDGLDDCI